MNSTNYEAPRYAVFMTFIYQYQQQSFPVGFILGCRRIKL